MCLANQEYAQFNIELAPTLESIHDCDLLTSLGMQPAFSLRYLLLTSAWLHTDNNGGYQQDTIATVLSKFEMPTTQAVTISVRAHCSHIMVCIYEFVS